MMRLCLSCTTIKRTCMTLFADLLVLLYLYQVSEERSVVSEGAQIALKEVTLADTDSDGSILLVLWRNHASSAINVGDKLRISNLKIKEFSNSLQANTTSKTKIEVRNSMRIYTSYYEYIYYQMSFTILYRLHDQLQCVKF